MVVVVAARFWVCDSGVGPVRIALAGTETGMVFPGVGASWVIRAVDGVAPILPTMVTGSVLDAAWAATGRLGCSVLGGG